MASLIRLPREEPAGLPLVPGGQGGGRFSGFGVGRGFAIWGPFPVQASVKAPESAAWSTRSDTKSGKFAALLFHGLCRLGKIDWASESHQELDRCLSRTITASKNFND